MTTKQKTIGITVLVASIAGTLIFGPTGSILKDTKDFPAVGIFVSDTPVESVSEAVQALSDDGKRVYIGVSGKSGEDGQKYMKFSRNGGMSIVFSDETKLTEQDRFRNFIESYEKDGDFIIIEI